MIYLSFDIEGLYQTFISRGYQIKIDSSSDEIDFYYRLNQTLKQKNIIATFFVLASLVNENRKYKEIIKDLSNSGHEIASHGMFHRNIRSLNQGEIYREIRSSKEILENLINKKVLGYRAPSFSLDTSYTMFYEELADNGYVYSSSTYARGVLSRFGSNIKPNNTLEVNTKAGKIIEVPVNTIGFRSINTQFGGGLYFRIAPVNLTKMLIKLIKKNDPFSLPIFYAHAYDFVQTKLSEANVPLFLKILHNINSSKSHEKFIKLIDHRDCVPLKKVL